MWGGVSSETISRYPSFFTAEHYLFLQGQEVLIFKT